MDLLIGKVLDLAVNYSSTVELLVYGNLKVFKIHLSDLQHVGEEDSFLSFSAHENAAQRGLHRVPR